jgi:hypothetical protein
MPAVHLRPACERVTCLCTCCLPSSAGLHDRAPGAGPGPGSAPRAAQLHCVGVHLLLLMHLSPALQERTTGHQEQGRDRAAHHVLRSSMSEPIYFTRTSIADPDQGFGRPLGRGMITPKVAVVEGGFYPLSLRPYHHVASLSVISFPFSMPRHWPSGSRAAGMQCLPVMQRTGGSLNSVQEIAKSTTSVPCLEGLVYDACYPTGKLVVLCICGWP